MTTGGFRSELPHGCRARTNDLGAHMDQLLIPGVEHVLAALAGGDPFEQPVALLQHPAQAGERSRVTRLDLDEHLVQEAPAELGSSLHQPQVVGPEQRDPKVAR